MAPLLMAQSGDEILPAALGRIHYAHDFGDARRHAGSLADADAPPRLRRRWLRRKLRRGERRRFKR